MSDNSWAEYAESFENKSDLYNDFLKRAGFTSVEHYAIILLGDPRLEDFLRKIRKRKHIYSTGDRLSKIAHKHYGDSRYWWVLAWFNGKPTDFHCKIGDIIEIPMPLDAVLPQFHSRMTE